MNAMSRLPEKAGVGTVQTFGPIQFPASFAILAMTWGLRDLELDGDPSVRLVAPDGLRNNGFQNKQGIEEDEQGRDCPFAENAAILHGVQGSRERERCQSAQNEL
jgi:hypothetical protein